MQKNKNQRKQTSERADIRKINLTKVTKIGIAIYLVIAVILSMLLIIVQNQKSSKLAKSKILDPELARAMTYEKFGPGSDDVYSANGETKVDNVKFSAFFLRDLDGDGYAEKLMGTCKEIGLQDTLYMEVNVLTEGKLTNGKIEINGQNFYFQTVLPKDQQLKENYIGNNIKIIEFNEMSNGTQKMLAGLVRSGDYTYPSSATSAIGNDIDNYSQINSIVFTGTYVDENNQEIEIRKEVNLAMDWYGSVRAEIPATVAGIENTYQQRDLETALDREQGTLNLNFIIGSYETKNKLILKDTQVKATIPDLNGYAPSSVEVENSNVQYTYNQETHELVITRESTIDEENKLYKTCYDGTYLENRYNKYNVKLTYPIEAYDTIGEDAIEIHVPVQVYYDGYNNPKPEFNNPYKSNTATGTIVAKYSNPQGSAAKFTIEVGKYMYQPTRRYVVSKQKPLKIYNAQSTEEQDDIYQVRWYGFTGTAGSSSGMVMKETKNEQSQISDQFVKADSSLESMNNLTTNIGIGFSGVENLLNDDGWIKVYDEENNNLLVTFDKTNWTKYTKANPYYYEVPVKHIRIETSQTKQESSISVYNIKKLDDEYITNNYTREEFDNLKYIKSTLTGYLGENYINTDTHTAVYEAPYSIAEISISKDVLSTQETEKHDNILIKAQNKTEYNQIGWVNGSFLVKLPEEIIDIQINNIEINNSAVKLVNYELKEENGTKLIKINTENVNQAPQSYDIIIDCDLTPDPRIATTSKAVELWASNEEAQDYYYQAEDIYDVNDNINTQEKVNKRTATINMVAPNSLLISQIASQFDGTDNQIISPQIAEVTPQYITAEASNKTAKIGIHLKNNYSSTISEMKLIGVIPFEGNKYVIANRDIGSQFTTKMTNSGLTVPAELEGQVVVYYSENEHPSNDLTDEANGWKMQDEVTNWDNIKTFMIDFQDYVLEPSKTVLFEYTVKMQNGIADLNKVAYSETGVYFALDTDEGKYKTQTEPNKLGLRIVEKYNLNLTKYQTGKTKKVSGATYLVTEEGIAEGKTAITNTEGTLEIKNLYTEKVYEIKEIKSPVDYELNGGTIKFIAHVTETGGIEIEKLSGETRTDLTVTIDSTTNMPTVNLQTQDEAKAKLKIIKTEKDTENRLSRVSYRITGEGLPDSGKVLTTNIDGETNIGGLKVGAEYTLMETKAEGYYLNDPVKFTITNNNGTYELQVTGETKGSEITLDNEIPTINLELEDDKIPTYDLQINKIVEGSQTEQNPIGTPIQGAKFKLYKGEKEQGTYETDENGHVTIQGLYQYEEARDIDQTYKLVETYAPEGYAKTTDIIFSSQTIDEVLQLDEIMENKEAHKYTVENNTIILTVEDNPSFRLTKKDGETNELLPNTKFAIYNVDEGEVPARNSKGEIIGTKETINGREYYTLTTDENGQIIADLPEGLYKAVEVEADEKYDISQNTKYFGIGASREGKTTIVEEWATIYGGNRF